MATPERLQEVERPVPADLNVALAERNRDLCDAIRAGEYNSTLKQATLYEHLLASTRAQLEVSNPDYLEALAAERREKKRNGIP